METLFFIIQNDEQRGPFTVAELKEMNITPSTPVWSEGMPDWTTADEVPLLEPLLAAASDARFMHPDMRPDEPIAPPAIEAQTPPQWNPQQPQPQGAPSQPMPAQQSLQLQQKKSARPWIIAAVFIGILALLIFTKPSRDEHVDAVTASTRAYLNEQIEQQKPTDDGIFGKIFGTIFGEESKWLTGKALDEFINNYFTVSDYFVCTVGHLDFQGKSQNVSFGILGHVFTFSKEDVASAVNKSIVKTQEEEKAAFEQEQEKLRRQQAQADSISGIDPYIEEEEDILMSTMDSISRRSVEEAMEGLEKWAKKKMDEMMK